MRVLAAISLLAALGAANASTSVTVQPSSLTFKEAMAACPGALAGITITLNHVRIAEQPGVTSDIDDADPMAQAIALSASGGASAKVTVNAKTHQVVAKNVKLSGHNVACIAPD